MEIVVGLLMFVVAYFVSHVMLRKLLRRIGYDRWVYQRLYDRDKFWMSKSGRAHMRQKFKVTD